MPGGDDARIAGAGLEAEPVLLLEYRHVVAGLGEEIGRGHPDDAASEHQSLHALDVEQVAGAQRVVGIEH